MGIFTVVALVIAFVALRRTRILSDEIKLLRRVVDHFPLQESGEEIDFQEKDVEAAVEEASDAIVDEPRKWGDVIGGPDFSPPTPLSTESLEPQTPQINCPECGQEFEVSRTSCPACGCPVAIAQYDSSSDETVAVEPAKAAIDIETQIGTTWLLRIGLVVLAIALALFALPPIITNAYTAVREVPEDALALLVIGHNPTMGYLAQLLDDGDGDEDASNALVMGYPTSAMTVFDLTGDWADLDEQGGTVVAHHVPRS